MKRLAQFGLSTLFLLVGCVSVDGPPLPKGSILKDQRTIILAFASPGPVMMSDESNVGAAMDIIPGLGQAVQSVRNERNVALSQDLAQNLPPGWNPGADFTPILRKELDRSGNPGIWVMAADSEIIPDRIRVWNESSDVADWTTRYYGMGPIQPTTPRNYDRIPGIEDTLIFEVNLAWGLSADVDGNQTPFLSSQTRLFQARDNKLLWSHEDRLDDGSLKASYDTLKPNAMLLSEHWEGLMQHLAATISDGFRANLTNAGLYAGPAYSTSTAAGMMTAKSGGSAYSLGVSSGTAYSLQSSTGLAPALPAITGGAYALPAIPVSPTGGNQRHP